MPAKVKTWGVIGRLAKACEKFLPEMQRGRESLKAFYCTYVCIFTISTNADFVHQQFELKWLVKQLSTYNVSMFRSKRPSSAPKTLEQTSCKTITSNLRVRFRESLLIPKHSLRFHKVGQQTITPHHCTSIW